MREFQKIGFVCHAVKGDVVWNTWPDDLADGTQIYIVQELVDNKGSGKQKIVMPVSGSMYPIPQRKKRAA